jgi:hypothetical protein
MNDNICLRGRKLFFIIEFSVNKFIIVFETSRPTYLTIRSHERDASHPLRNTVLVHMHVRTVIEDSNWNGHKRKNKSEKDTFTAFENSHHVTKESNKGIIKL